jgi:UDP-N-acetylmuramoylalanine--D-glutamate ligase
MRDWAKSNVMVVGLGKSGLSAIALLREKGARVTASDEKPLTDLPLAAAKLQELDVSFLAAWEDAAAPFDTVVLSPGVPLDLGLVQRARERGAEILGEVELAALYLKGRNIGITGSNGKTTTTALIGHILKSAGIPSQVGGNIGTPPTAMIPASTEEAWNVLELSSFQLETIDTFRAAIALCLNITPDHLDRHGTMENYVAAKARLFETQEPGDWAILNAEDEWCVQLGKNAKGFVHWFSIRRDLRDGFVYIGDDPLLPASKIPLPGRHNIENVMAAAAAAKLAGAELPAIAEAVQTFPGVEHRLEFVRELRGVKYYNDSKATNVDATEKALDAFDGRLWIILGGKDKHSDYRVLAGRLAAKAKGVLLIGMAAPIIREQLHEFPSLPMADCGTIEVAIRTAYEQASAGDTILLAPACASFDQFQSYEHRGRVFKQLVNELRG